MYSAYRYALEAILLIVFYYKRNQKDKKGVLIEMKDIEEQQYHP